MRWIAQVVLVHVTIETATKHKTRLDAVVACSLTLNIKTTIEYCNFQAMHSCFSQHLTPVHPDVTHSAPEHGIASHARADAGRTSHSHLLSSNSTATSGLDDVMHVTRRNC